ncbi:MAG: L-serine ammonia-lyase, iron-sulfur-dependent, subunit alpha [Spirochaetales bacterium]|nr:L-serine ammonia-lyase, iron-sulfur-dependent, subunit alpha [Spirochaetales bacterium]
MKINTFEELLTKCSIDKKKIHVIIEEKESAQHEISREDVRLKTKKILDAMKQAISSGLGSAELSLSRQSGDDCQKLQQRFTVRPSLFGSLFEKITTYALATSEENIRMGRIVACPTAGSCGIVPSVLVASSEFLGVDEQRQIDALITAGAIGSIVANKTALAGAVGGCQAECGVASAMAAGGLVVLLGGSNEQVVQSVSLALKNILGLTCDPVAGLVEIPCVKRNSFLAVHAVTAAELAISCVESKIPADEVVDALVQTGQLMSPLLKETSQGGLAKTKRGIEIEKGIFG